MSTDIRVERRASESVSARSRADAATARLARLQRITAALSDTVTQDAVADSVLREAMVALECDAGAVVVRSDDSENLTLLRECGTLDPVMRSFAHDQPGFARGPNVDAIQECEAVYHESFEEVEAKLRLFEPGEELRWIASTGALKAARAAQSRLP